MGRSAEVMSAWRAKALGLRAAVAAVLCLPVLAFGVDLQIATFTDSPDPAPRGGEITYTITALNGDSDTASNAVVTMAIPVNSVFVSSNDPAVPGACVHDGGSPGVVTCTYPTLLGTLAAPAGPVRTISVVLRTTGATGITLNASAGITSPDVDVNPANNTLSQNTTINDGADLSATLSGAPNPALGGGTVTWTVSGSNLGPNTAGATSFTTTLPGVLSYVSGAGTGWACSAAGQVVTCSRGPIAVGAYPNLSIVTRIVGVSAGTVTINGNISSTVGDPVLANNSPFASVAVSPGADLAVTQDPPSPSPAPSASAVTLTLRPSNLGPYPATAGAQVTFPLPAGFSVSSATGSAGWSCASAGAPPTVSCTFAGSLASGATGTLTVLASTPSVVSSTTYSGITATIAANPGGPADPDASNNSAARSLTVLPDGVDLSVSKSKSPAFVALGANISSAIIVSNAGPRTAASGTITVVDALDPAREVFVSASGSNWACVSAPPNVSCTYNAALAIGNSSTLTITTQAIGVGTATNTATVGYSGVPGDYNAGNDSISASVTVTADNNSPDLAASVSVATAGGAANRVEANETRVTYTATLTNKVIATSADARDVRYTLSIPGRRTTTPVTVAGIVLTNTSGGSTATFTCAGASPVTSGGLTCTQGAATVLRPGDVITFTVHADRPLNDGSFTGNAGVTATATSLSQGDPLPSDNTARADVFIDPIADVEVVSKILAANPVLAGTIATYTITLRNNGPSSAAGVTLADAFTVPGGDTGFTFLSVVASNSGTCGGLTTGTTYGPGISTLNCSWAAGVTSGSTRTVTVVVRPNWQAGVAPRTLFNEATVATTTPEDSVGGEGAALNRRSLTLNIDPAQVDVLINNTDAADPLGYDPAVPSNNDITYAVAATNNGPSLASGTGFSFLMSPPVGKTITFRGDGAAAGVAAANPAGVIPGSLCDQLGNSVTGPASLTVSCSHPAPAQMSSTQTVTRYMVFRVDSPPATGGDVYNTTATTVINETDTNGSNNAESESTTVRVRADLGITKTPSINPVQLRQPFDWSVVVTNAGPGDSQTTGLTDTLPAGMAFGPTAPSWTLSSGGSGTCGVAGQTMTCAFGVVPAGAAATVTVAGVRVTSYPGGGTTQNCASATTSEVDPFSGNNVSVCSTLTVQRSSLAGTVFQDRDRVGPNGGTPQSAAIDPRISGVTVALSGTDAYGNVVTQNTTSNASGDFSFANLSPAGAGGYLITQTQPTGFINGPVNPPVPVTGGSYAAGGVAGNSSWIQIALAGNSAGSGYNFPEVRQASLSGFVYVDANLNGVRDPAIDPAIVGATVRLLDAGTLLVVATATTSGTGAYSFSGLDPLTIYVLEQPLPSSPAGLINGAINVGLIDGLACAAGCTAQPDTPVAGTDRIAAIDLSAGADGTLFNFGERQQTAISGTVYVDRDRDNVIDPTPGDGRITGVTVRLVQGADCGSGTTLQTTTTDPSGNYGFAGVIAGGNYLLCQTQPAGYANGVENPGTAAATTGANVIAITALPTGGSTGNHFGERIGSITGSVYTDFSPATPANTDNGVRDAGETGINNVPVTLSGRDVLGNVVSLATSTDAGGNYRFDDLLQSDGAGYTVSEGAIPPASGSFNDGRDRIGSAGGNGAINDVTSAIVLGAGVLGSNYDFGELPVAPITGTVYIDRDRDNVLDPTPTDGRLGGVTLTLVLGNSCAGTVLATTTSDVSGNYVFSGNSAGLTYTICQAQPAGYADGGVNPGVNGASSAANTITISNLPASGSAGNHFAERVGSIAGSVFLDADNNGVRAGAETGFAGVAITLSGVDGAGNPVNRSVSTDGSGSFRFDDLLAAGPGGYTVTEQPAQPVSGTVTTLNGRTSAGTSGGIATAVATTPSAINAIALAAGADSTANLFGEILPVAVSGTVFIDLDNNGVQNLPADAGLAGVTITASGTDDTGAAVNRSVTTAADGSYSLLDLRPGNYVVTEPVQPTGTSNGQTIAGSAGGSVTGIGTLPSAISGLVLTTPGTSSTGNNFAEIANSSAIAGRVWLDADNDGAIGASETGIAGVTIELTGTDAASRPVNLSTTTDASGNFQFSSLAPGVYALREPTQPAGTVNGVTRAGSAGGTATAVATTPSAIGVITLPVGVTSTANLFGEVPAASIAGRVWADNNDNGVIEPAETGLGGVSVQLTGTDDLGNPVTASASTAADGSYRFDVLRPGTYTVTEPSQPAGTVNGRTVAGSTGGSVTTPAIVPSVISAIVLPPGVASVDNNFGELGNSPDLRVSKSMVGAVFTVTQTGSYLIVVRNAGEVASNGSYTVSDRLPAGLTLVAAPTGSGWACTGAANDASFDCTSSAIIAAGASGTNPITVIVNVGAPAAAASPVNNVVMVDGGGEIDARRPSVSERDAFLNNPGALPVCTTPAAHNACRTPTAVQLAAAISGTVWHDIGSSTRLLDGGDRRLPSWLVEIIDVGSGQIVGRASTGTDGSYRVIDLIPGVPLAVRFRDPDSGVIFGYPVNGETAPDSSGAPCNPAVAPGGSSSCVDRSANPVLSVILAPGQELPQQSLPVDPSGIVYDSGARTPVAGAVVTLAPSGTCAGWNPATSVVGGSTGGYVINASSISMTVGADGFYQYFFAPGAPANCTFALSVTPPPSYTFVSQLIVPTAGPLIPGGAPGSVFPVQPQAGAPIAPVGSGTTYYLTFSGGSAGANIVHNHIPLDPLLPTGINLSKTGDKQQVEVGDSLRYTISVQVTAGALPRQTTVVDRLPAGFTYIRGTAMVNDVPIADPQGGSGPTLAFHLGATPPNGLLVLRYRARVGVGSQEGDGINRAIAHACGVQASCVGPDFTPLPGSATTNEGRYRVRISGGVFGTDACVLGKIFVDCNGNHIQDAEEIGIPGVRLVMEDGTTLIADSEGKYSICGLPPKSHVLKVDPSTLPIGARLTTSSNRNLGDAGSLWLDLKNGELHRADFVEGSCSNRVLDQVKARRAQGEVRAPEAEKGPVLRFDSKAHGLTPQSTPQQGTDGANQTVPKPRRPAAGAEGGSHVAR